MKRLLFGLVLLTGTLNAQMKSPAVMVGDRVRLTIDSIAAIAWREQLEPGICVSQWTQTADTIVILGLSTANLFQRLAGSVQWTGSLCGDSLPSIHGHLLGLGHWDRPSPQDWVLAVDTIRKRAPFHLILIIEDNGVASRLIPYGVKLVP